MADAKITWTKSLFRIIVPQGIDGFELRDQNGTQITDSQNTRGIYFIYTNSDNLNIGNIRYVGKAGDGINTFRRRFEERLRTLREFQLDLDEVDHVRVRIATLTNGDLSTAEKLCTQYVYEQQLQAGNIRLTNRTNIQGNTGTCEMAATNGDAAHIPNGLPGLGQNIDL